MAYESTIPRGSGGKRTPAGRKFFTLAEARRALPLVQRITRDIQASHAERARLNAELTSGVVELTQNGSDRLQQAFEQQTQRLATLVDELHQIGVDLKDPARGLVDFPARFQDREINLCYQLDEPTIAYWHELDTGYAGRRPVDELGANA